MLILFLLFKDIQCLVGWCRWSGVFQTVFNMHHFHFSAVVINGDGFVEHAFSSSIVTNFNGCLSPAATAAGSIRELKTRRMPARYRSSKNFTNIFNCKSVCYWFALRIFPKSNVASESLMLSVLE
jgi:hypothetical protein